MGDPRTLARERGDQAFLLRRRFEEAGDDDVQVTPRVDCCRGRRKHIGKRRAIDGAHVAKRRVKALGPSGVNRAVVGGEQIAAPSAPAFPAAPPSSRERPRLRCKIRGPRRVRNRRIGGRDDLLPAATRLRLAKQARKRRQRVAGKHVAPQLLEPCRPRKHARRRPCLATTRPLRAIVRSDERARQSLVGRNDGGSRG